MPRDGFRDRSCSPASQRHLRQLAKESGLVIGMPVELSGPPTQYLDLQKGTEQPVSAIDAALAKMEGLVGS